MSFRCILLLFVLYQNVAGRVLSSGARVDVGPHLRSRKHRESSESRRRRGARRASTKFHKHRALRHQSRFINTSFYRTTVDDEGTDGATHTDILNGLNLTYVNGEGPDGATQADSLDSLKAAYVDDEDTDGEKAAGRFARLHATRMDAAVTDGATQADSLDSVKTTWTYVHEEDIDWQRAVDNLDRMNEKFDSLDSLKAAHADSLDPEIGRELRVHVLDFMALPFTERFSSARLRDVVKRPRELYGNEHCFGGATFLQEAENLPSDFCVHDQAWGYDFAGHFDEFSTERLLLSRWVEAPEACSYHPPFRRCPSAAFDVVVAPSLFMHFMRNLTDKHNVEWDIMWSFNATEHDMYWSTLRKIVSRMHEKSGRLPHIVVHFSYAFDAPFAGTMLDRLMHQPPWFTNKVIIASPESDLPKSRLLQMHSNFTPFVDHAVFQRAHGRLRSREQGTPTLVSLPYPVPVLDPVPFMQPGESYNPEKQRRIAVLLAADTNRQGKAGNNIRPVLRERLQEAGAVCSAQTCVICAGSPDTPGETLCPEAFRNNESDAHLGSSLENMWDFATSSTFCLEPPGDTLTRSHFFVAVFAGCIPVIFDGGHNGFTGAPTAWPFRSFHRPTNFSVDYTNFTLSYQAEPVIDGEVDFVKELMSMPETNPERFMALRYGLDRAAKTLHYAVSECGAPESDCDAFSRFRHLLRHLRGMPDRESTEPAASSSTEPAASLRLNWFPRHVEAPLTTLHDESFDP